MFALGNAFEIYGGTAGFFTYGPPGAAVKQNFIELWRRFFVIEENLMEACKFALSALDLSGAICPLLVPCAHRQTSAHRLTTRASCHMTCY